jgi:hypothetical protein
VSSIGNLEREEQAVYPLPESWRMFHGTAHTGRIGALPEGGLEARQIRALHMTGMSRMFWEPRGR